MNHLSPVPDVEPEDWREPAPTHDQAAEAAVLGSVLLNPKVCDDALDAGLRGDDFHAPRHETIWDAIEELITARKAVDPVTVAAALQSAGELTRVGGPAYLHTLTAGVATPANVGYYAAIVVELAHKRRIIAVGTRIAQMGRADAGPSSNLISSAAAEVEAVADRAHGRTRDDISDALDEAIGQLELGVPASPSGIPELDGTIRGWVPGTLVTVGARPGVGKTAVLIQAVMAAVLRGEPAGLTSLEMPRSELLHRAIANLGRVDYGRLQASPGQPLTDAEWRAVSGASERLRTPLLHLSDRSWATVATVAHDIRSHTRKHGRPPTVWAVDYLQLLTPGKGSGRENREQQVAAMSRGLKLTAKALGTCILLGAQLNRDGAEAPKITHLRESGAVEQDSDRVILLHRDMTPDGDPTVLDLIVGKNRQGRTGTVTVTWEGAYQRISPRKWTPSGMIR